MAVASARSPAGALSAGWHGLGLLSVGGTGDEAMQFHSGNWALYADTAVANGHVPDRKNWRVATLLHVADTREQARANVTYGLDRYCDYVRDVAPFPLVPNGVADRCQYLIESGAACVGTPDDAIAFIERLQTASGGFGVLLEQATNWADWAQTKRHYELMARYVHPHFQSSRAWRADSYRDARAHRDAFAAPSKADVQADIDRVQERLPPITKGNEPMLPKHDRLVSAPTKVIQGGQAAAFLPITTGAHQPHTFSGNYDPTGLLSKFVKKAPGKRR